MEAATVGQRLAALALRLAAGLVARLPLDVATAAGAALGRGYARLGLPRVRDARLNLAIAFPERSPRAREELLLASFADLGRRLIEVAFLATPRRELLMERVRVEGEEHLVAARAAHPSGGVLLLTAHFGTWELALPAMARRGLPMAVVERGSANPAIAALMAGWRGVEQGVRLLRMDASAALGVLAALRGGRVLAVALDQNARRDEGVFAPFFGEPACTRSAPVLLAMKRGFALLPAFVLREGQSHVIRALPPIALEPPGDDEAAALARNVAAVNAVLEAQIRRAPAQWLWVHRRFRTRPEGLPPVGYGPSPRRWLRRRFHGRGALRSDGSGR